MFAAAAAAFGLAVAALVAFNAAVARRAKKLVPPVGRFVTVDGVRLHYLDQGSGPAVLLIHGLSSQLQTFTYGVTGLLAPGYRLIAVDRPGSGYSQPAASATLGAQAALLDGFLGALGVERALVVGHSLGGAVALALALDHPARVAGMALVAPATQPEARPPEALRKLVIRSDLLRWTIAWTIAGPLALWHREAILAALFAPDPVPPDFAVRAGAVLGTRPSSYRNAARDLVEAGGEIPTYARRYPSLAVPAGVLFGRGDRILAPALHSGALQHQIAGLSLEWVEDGGHMTPISSPERTAAFIAAMAARAFQPTAGTAAR